MYARKRPLPRCVYSVDKTVYSYRWILLTLARLSFIFSFILRWLLPLSGAAANVVVSAPADSVGSGAVTSHSASWLPWPPVLAQAAYSPTVYINNRTQFKARYFLIVLIRRRYDMNGRSQRQGGKNLIFPQRDNCKAVLLRLSLAGNLEKNLLCYVPLWGRMEGAWLWTPAR